MEESTGDWFNCTLCRSGREGTRTLAKAKDRGVEWPQPNTRLTNPIQDPVVHTSLDDAFASMMQFMTISTRKCGRYHHSHKPHRKGSRPDKHCLRYHSPQPQTATLTNPLSKPSVVSVNAAPGTYSITAAKWSDADHREGESVTTTHVVRVQPGQSISLTLSV